MNSREKGKRGERQWRDELRANGYTARRGQQFSGSADSPDVVCEELGWIHFEVKAVERLNIEDAMEQARRDQAGLGCNAAAAAKIPIVAHRRSRRPWLVTMEAEFFFELIREFQPVAAPRADGSGVARRVARGQSGDVSPHSKVMSLTSENILGMAGETPALPGTNNNQQQNQNNEPGGHRPPLQEKEQNI